MTMTTSPAGRAAVFDRAAFYNEVRDTLFGRTLHAPQVSGMTVVLDEWSHSGFADLRWLAYILATVFHETAQTMQPVEEYGKGKGHLYGVPTGPWHNVYDGRGDVQLTWEDNYKKASGKLRARGFDVDLDRYPEQALRPDVSAAIVIYGSVEGWFTGRTLADYFGIGKADPVNARRVINGLDQANLIAGYYFAFMKALALAEAAPVQVAVKQETATYAIPVPSPGPVTIPAPEQNGSHRWWAWLTRRNGVGA